MKTELIDVSPTRKEIKIEIDANDVREAYDRISSEYARKASVSGFRPGHAPKSVVRTRFKSEIRSDLLRELVPDAIADAIQELKLAPIAEPDVHLDNKESLDRPGEGPIAVHVHIEVLPPIELKEYKGLELVRRVRPISDEDVKVLIEQFRRGSASLLPVEDRVSQLGDIVSIDIKGRFIEPADQEEIDVKDVEVVLGGDGVQPEFTENLLGVVPDDERTFLVAYPQDYSTENLAGKKVEYSAKVTAVRIEETPALDDDWARTIDEEAETLEVFRERVRERLESGAASEADDKLKAEAVRRLVDEHNVEVPESLIEHQTNYLMESLVRDMISRGIDPRAQAVDWEGIREKFKPQAARNVSGSLLLEEIAKRENITVSNDEIEDEIDFMTAISRQPREQVVAALTKEGGERSIASRLRNRKALDLLIENARVTEGEWQPDTPLDDTSDLEQEVEPMNAQSNQSDEEERESSASSSSP